MTPLVEISIVVPVFNEEETLHELVPRLKKVCHQLDKSYEILFVDDGSRDGSFDVLLQFQSSDENIRLVKFTRNFGQQAAVLAGFRQCRGEIIIQLDSDLQHPPELILDMLDLWLNGGYDVVEAVKSSRGTESFFSRISNSVP